MPKLSVVQWAVGHVALSLMLAGQLVPGVGADTFRQGLLDMARDRIEVYYADENNLESPKEKDGVQFRVSKNDKSCGGDGVPLEFFEFDIDNVRPVDAFNSIADVLKQPSWDSHCSKMELLRDVESKQARAYVGLFAAKPFANREVYEWQVAAANFSSEEFWVVFSSVESDELKQLKPTTQGAVQMQTCLAAYRITNVAGKAHVIISEQVNTHPWPLSARDVIKVSWGDSVDFVKGWRSAAKKQANQQWNATETTVPGWMLEDRPCGAPVPDIGLKEKLLVRAALELNRSDPGHKQPDQSLPHGGSLQTWESNEVCGGGGVPPHKVPRWQAKFSVPGAKPADVFNVLVAKRQEKQWNTVSVQANITGFRKGARGLHESFAMPKGFGKWVFGPRELWEWQVADHSIADDTYTIAYTSMTEPNTESFSGSTKAVQCLAVYEISPAPLGGALVHMSSHMNPNIGLRSVVFKLWASAGKQTIHDFAVALSSEATKLANQSGEGALFQVDSDASMLLEPQPPNTNAAMTIAEVLSSTEDSFNQDFISLDVSHVLDVSAWEPGSFKARTEEVVHLFDRLANNATETEAAAFRDGPAPDSIALQFQGEVLTAIQWRVLTNETLANCSQGPLPDIDGDTTSKSLPLVLLAGFVVGGLAFCLIMTLGLCCCFKQYSRRKLRLTNAAALLNEQHSSSHDSMDTCAGP